MHGAEVVAVELFVEGAILAIDIGDGTHGDDARIIVKRSDDGDSFLLAGQS